MTLNRPSPFEEYQNTIKFNNISDTEQKELKQWRITTDTILTFIPSFKFTDL